MRRDELPRSLAELQAVERRGERRGARHGEPGEADPDEWEVQQVAPQRSVVRSNTRDACLNAGQDAVGDRAQLPRNDRRRNEHEEIHVSNGMQGLVKEKNEQGALHPRQCPLRAREQQDE